LNDYPPLEVKVWGDFACFTRPEMKVERVTYPVMTPSAARGILEAIFWKPQFRWLVREIAVLKNIAYFSIMRNEVTSRASERAAQSRIAMGGANFAEDDRAQRHTLALRDVAYVIRADIEVRMGIADDVAKYRDQFRRRVKAGQCFHQPCLGCREFTAFFSAPDANERPIASSEGLGSMLFDLDYARDGSGRGTPHFFEAALENGVLSVPSTLYAQGNDDVATAAR
jgi:CRISPR-associated protein Cas5d